MADKKQVQQNQSAKKVHKPSPEQTADLGKDAAPGYSPGFDNQKQLPEHVTANTIRRSLVKQMQTTVGNQRVVKQLHPSEIRNILIQRTQINDPATREVIHNQTDPTSQRFTPGGRGGSYHVSSVNITGGGAGTVNYQMTRTGAGLVVNVRIKFVTEFGAAPATNWLGQTVQSLSGERVAVPVPPNHQQTARNICTGLVTFWNNKFSLVGQRAAPTPRPAPGMAPDGGMGPAPPTPAAPTPAPTPAPMAAPGTGSTAPVAGTAPAGGTAAAPAAASEIVLPVTFVATPVFDLNGEADTTVRFDATNAAGGGNVIDSAHWYANMGNYPGGINDTYAHEYGHLLGIPDEYSLSNPNAHALMHQISPSQGTQMSRTLDQAGKRQLILSAIRPHLRARIGAIGGEVARSLDAQQADMSRALATGLRAAWRAAGVISSAAAQIRTQLESAGHANVARSVDRVLRFEALQNLSNITLADAAVPAELSPAAIQRLINSAFTAAANQLQMPSVNLNVPGQTGSSSQMTVGVRLAPGAEAASSPLNTAAATAAREAVGRPAAAGAPGATPPVYPSNTLIGALTAMSSGWDNVGSQMESSVSTMQNEITSAMNAALTTDISGEVGGSTKRLYEVLYNLVNNVSTTAMRNTLRQFLNSQISPILRTQITDLIGLIETEPARHTRATGTGTDAAPATPPSPALMTAASSMRTQAQQMLNPPAPAGGGPAQQNVTYSTHTLMGSNSAGQSLRTQQMQSILNHFNNTVPDLRHDGEETFNIRSTGT